MKWPGIPAAKLGDFGLATHTDNGDPWVNPDNLLGIGPLNWMAPVGVLMHVFTAFAYKNVGMRQIPRKSGVSCRVSSRIASEHSQHRQGDMEPVKSQT